MPRDLTTDQETSTATSGRRSTLAITLSDGTVLRFSTADTLVGSDLYQGKLAPVDELNLDATQTIENISFKISNIELTFGQDLINNVDLLSGASAVLGTYFSDDDWHDVKLQGTISVGDIDGNWVNVTFEDITNKNYNGVTISSLFPDAQIPAAELPSDADPPLAAVNDLYNVQGSEAMRTLSPFLEGNQYGGRYEMPEFQINES